MSRLSGPGETEKVGPSTVSGEPSVLVSDVLFSFRGRFGCDSRKSRAVVTADAD